MVRTLTFAVIVVLLGVSFVPCVNAGELSMEYLYGRWVIDDQSCASPDSEYMEFRKNGTFENTRTGKTEIVGFWELDEEILNLHMVTSPAFFDDLNPDLQSFESEYNYFQARVVIFNTQKKNFEAFGVIGNEMKRMTAARCQ
jgi:hypothetical protein